MQHVGGNITVGNLEVSYWSEITGGDVEAYDSLYTLWAAAVQYEDPIHKLKDSVREGTARVISSIKPVTKVPGIIFGTGQLYNIAQPFGPLNLSLYFCRM